MSKTQVRIFKQPFGKEARLEELINDFLSYNNNSRELISVATTTTFEGDGGLRVDYTVAVVAYKQK